MLNGRKIDHVVLRTGDLEDMVRFYSDIFNAEVARRDDKIGLIQLRIGDFLLDLLRADVGGFAKNCRPEAVLDHLSIEVDPPARSDIEALSKKIGVKLQMRTLHGARGFGTSIMVEDPDGNRIEIKYYETRQ